MAIIDEPIIHSSLSFELAVSIGNTHIQYGVFSDDHGNLPIKVEKQSYVHQKSISTTESTESTSSKALEKKCEEIVRSLYKTYPLKKAYLASVNPSINSAVKKVIDHELNLTTYILTYKDLRVNTDYDVKAIGIDRLLKINAANKLVPHANLIIIDFGTAITLDAVKPSEPPKHIGGMIVSGFHTSLRALNTFTEQLPLLTFPYIADNITDKDSNLSSLSPSLLGTDTKSAILNGSYHFYLGALDSIITKAMLEFFMDRECKVWVTGGDAHFFYNHLKNPVEYIKQLNLIALKIASEQINS